MMMMIQVKALVNVALFSFFQNLRPISQSKGGEARYSSHQTCIGHPLFSVILSSTYRLIHLGFEALNFAYMVYTAILKIVSVKNKEVKFRMYVQVSFIISLPLVLRSSMYVCKFLVFANLKLS